MGNTPTTTKQPSKFRGASDDIVKAIKTTKKKAVKINRKQKGVLNYATLGAVLGLGVLGYAGTSTVLAFGITSGELATFSFVASMVSWLADKTDAYEKLDRKIK